MKVYVLESTTMAGSDRSVVGVFTTREKAERTADALKLDQSHRDISELELDWMYMPLTREYVGKKLRGW